MEDQVTHLSRALVRPSPITLPSGLWLSVTEFLEIGSRYSSSAIWLPTPILGEFRGSTGNPPTNTWEDFLHIDDIRASIGPNAMHMGKYHSDHFTLMAPLHAPPLLQMTLAIASSISLPPVLDPLNGVTLSLPPYKGTVYLEEFMDRFTTPPRVHMSRRSQVDFILNSIQDIPCIALQRDLPSHLLLESSERESLQRFLSLASPPMDRAAIIADIRFPSAMTPPVIRWDFGAGHAGLTHSSQITLFSFSQLYAFAEAKGSHILVGPNTPLAILLSDSPTSPLQSLLGELVYKVASVIFAPPTSSDNGTPLPSSLSRYTRGTGEETLPPSPLPMDLHTPRKDSGSKQHHTLPPDTLGLDPCEYTKTMKGSPLSPDRILRPPVAKGGSSKKVKASTWVKRKLAQWHLNLLSQSPQYLSAKAFPPIREGLPVSSDTPPLSSPRSDRAHSQRSSRFGGSYAAALGMDQETPIPALQIPPLPHNEVLSYDPQAAPWVYVALSFIPGAGMGLFAKTDIPKGRVIGQYLGRSWLTPTMIQAHTYNTHNGFVSTRPLVVRDAQDLNSCAARYINDDLKFWNVKFVPVKGPTLDQNRVDIITLTPMANSSGRLRSGL